MSPRFTDQLRAGTEPLWSEAAGHRFTRELIEGTVAPDIMADYLIQDHRFLDAFLTLIGAAMAASDRFEARLRLARFAGLVAGEENTYFERAFTALGVSAERRAGEPDTEATAGFKGLMREAAERRSYAAALSVLTVAEWLYLDWASRAVAPLPESFVHREWITLHDNPGFRDFVAFLRAELDRVGPAEAALCQDLFGRAVALERRFFDAAYRETGR
ncbi:TenA family protein [Aureimonas sp. AU40]|uniref:TenA family protein n=1 Tax=Aureimonas sp. AU40 TaxID=1637747 RepID=UPI0007851732|nr:TenA family protein [Aureimonas sp. AU40]